MKKGVMYAIAAAILWALVIPFIKLGLAYDLDPLNFAGIRFTATGVILMAYKWHNGMVSCIMKHWKLFLKLIMLNMFVGYVCFYIGSDLVSGGISAIIAGMIPLINIIIAHLFTTYDKLNKYKVISILIGMLGLFLVIGMGNDGGAPLNTMTILGVGLLLGCIFVQGYMGVVVKDDSDGIDPVFLNAVQMFFGGGLLYLFAISTEGFQSPLYQPLGFYVALGILIFSSVFAFSFWFIALQSKDSSISDINMSRLIHPILAAILSWTLIPGEHPTVGTVSGLVVICCAILFYFKAPNYFEKRREIRAEK